MNRPLLIGAALLLLLLSFFFLPRQPEIGVRQDLPRQATEYSWAEKDVKFTLTLFMAEPNIGVAQYRASQVVPLAQQLPVLSRLLARALRDGRIRTLYLGRLVAFPELSERLALAAARSAGWDKKKGKPFTGRVNSFVAKLINDPSFAPELAALAEANNCRATFPEVEKVLISRENKLPFDCMVWLHLDKK